MTVPIKTIQLKIWDKDFTIIDFTRKPGLYNTNVMGFKSIHSNKELIKLIYLFLYLSIYYYREKCQRQ